MNMLGTLPRPAGALTSLGLVVSLALGCSSTSDGTTSAADAGAASEDVPAKVDAGSSADGDAAAAVKEEYAAVVRGKLASADVAVSKAAHDAIASGGEAQARAAGNFAHQAHLGTKLLDGAEGEFLAIDRWTDAKTMEGFYANPDVQKAFGSLFSSAPTVEFYALAPTWVTWGTMDSARGTGAWFNHLAVGTLKDTDTERNRAAHDAIASGGKSASMGAGNVAHVVYLGLRDRRKFVAFDLWPKSDNIQTFYSNEQFKAAFSSLFESVSQPVVQSTDWHAW